MSPPASLPAIASLPSAPDHDLTQLLDALFEPSPAIHAALLPVLRAAPHPSYDALIDACRARLLSLAAASSASSSSSSPSAADPALLSILGSHPRLGEKKVASAQSAAEQANLKAGAGSAKAQAEADELARLNREYEAAFPGLRYVVFVNGRGRPEVMRDMRVRIAGADFAAEVNAALQAMCDIAKDRASKTSARAE